MILSFLGLAGYWAGRTATEWLKIAAQATNYSNVADACYNAAHAQLGNDATWDAVKKLAESFIHSMGY